MTLIKTRIVTTLDEIQRCDAIRASRFLTFGGEYYEEFDSNDLAGCTHLLCETQGERPAQNAPVGTMRIRCLAGSVVAFERLAVLRQAPARTLPDLIHNALAYCDAKWIRTIVGTVNDDRLLKFWQRKGGVLMTVPAAETVDGRGWRYVRIDRKQIHNDTVTDAELQQMISRTEKTIAGEFQ